MWTISKVLAMAVLTGLSMMDYRIRKVPRDVLLLCMAAARRKKMAISVESRAAVTEPEKYIRDIRRIKK